MRDRITDLRRVPAAELRANPANWRSHPPAQRQALAEMLDRLGVVDAVIARETPDGLELIDGHLRADLAADETLPVLVVDLDDGEAAEALATLDPLAAMATTDGESLRTLVDGLDAAPPIPYSDLYGARTMGLPAATHTPGDQLRPPIRIYGGKTRSARFIVAALPDDLECYVEPFAGALAVLLARPRARREVANDLNGDIVAFWRAVRDQPAELARRVASTPSARSVFADCAARLAAGDFGDPVERAWCFAVAAQQSLASRGVSAANPSNWRRHMTGAPGGDWHRTQTAPWLDVAERIRRVQLDDIDATTLIGQVPPGAVVYCDPPYTNTSNTEPYAVNETSGFETAAIDAAARGCRVAVSGYHGDWPEIAASWNRVEWATQTAQIGQQAAARTEVLWMSYEPDADRLAEVGITRVAAP